jgi:phosphatidylserine/phosphatidylglycerophosphate/cardiolipin synthase-like enzyme
LLADGLDAFVARAVLSHRAERSIDAQYYLYHSDLVGKLFSDLLLKAADRGVRVRLLVDDMDFAGRDLEVVAMDSHPQHGGAHIQSLQPECKPGISVCDSFEFYDPSHAQ